MDYMRRSYNYDLILHVTSVSEEREEKAKDTITYTHIRYYCE